MIGGLLVGLGIVSFAINFHWVLGSVLLAVGIPVVILSEKMGR